MDLCASQGTYFRSNADLQCSIVVDADHIGRIAAVSFLYLDRMVKDTACLLYTSDAADEL